MPNSNEIRLVGRAVSRGIGIGPAKCRYGTRRQFFRRKITHPEIEPEIARFANAAHAARAAIQAEITEASSDRLIAVVELLESHDLILGDPTLISRIKDSIADQKVNAESAVLDTFEAFAFRLQSGGGHIREKYLDLQDVAERLLIAMDSRDETARFDEGSVIIASELRASTLLRLREAKAAGIATELGGWTSHFSILAREFEIPAVTGISHIFRSVGDGSIVAVNGFEGAVHVHPSEHSLGELRQISQAKRAHFEVKDSTFSNDLRTLDGRPIVIRTNTNSIESFQSALNFGIHGIGLYRSESLIGKYGRVPSEDEQADEYAAIAAAAGDHGVRIRMFDIDSDLSASGPFRRQKNPALGLRAIRLSFRDSELLLPQLRAILRVSAANNISIIVPMVTGVAEINEFRSILEQQKKILGEKGIRAGSPQIGPMIEVPSAALVADQLAQTSDFLCLGTNDLAQYILATDRDNDAVSEWFRTLHPAMLRIVHSVIESARKAGKQLIVCGEMAGSPFYVPVLIGLGAVELSMGPASVEAVRRVVSGIAFEEASALVRELSELTTPKDVEDAVLGTALKSWPHLYAPGFLEQRSG